MAWWAMYKWCAPWRKKPLVNYISFYRRYLYEQWYESLSDEEKQIHDEYVAKQKEEKERKFKRALLSLAQMQSFIRYHGAYDIPPRKKR